MTTYEALMLTIAFVTLIVLIIAALCLPWHRGISPSLDVKK